MSLVEVTTPSGKKKTVGIAQDQSDGVLTIVVLGATGDLAKKVPRDTQQFNYRWNAVSPARAAHFPCPLCSLHVKAYAREVPRGGRGPSTRRRQARHHRPSPPRPPLLERGYIQGCRFPARSLRARPRDV